METAIKNQIKQLFAAYSEIKLAYFFGSRKNGNSGPMSDYDFAIYLDSTDKKRIIEIQLDLIPQLSRIIHTDNLDLVILNSAYSDLKYSAITGGELLFERHPFKTIIEPEILNEYFDHQITLKQFDLTKNK